VLLKNQGDGIMFWAILPAAVLVWVLWSRWGVAWLLPPAEAEQVVEDEMSSSLSTTAPPTPSVTKKRSFMRGAFTNVVELKSDHEVEEIDTKIYYEAEKGKTLKIVALAKGLTGLIPVKALHIASARWALHLDKGKSPRIPLEISTIGDALNVQMTPNCEGTFTLTLMMGIRLRDVRICVIGVSMNGATSYT
jgi:hypothetical protein